MQSQGKAHVCILLQVRKWRRQLHFWDPKPEGDEIKIEVRSIWRTHHTCMQPRLAAVVMSPATFLPLENHETRPPLQYNSSMGT